MGPRRFFVGMTMTMIAVKRFIAAIGLMVVTATYAAPIELKTAAQVGGAPKFIETPDRRVEGFCIDFLQAISSHDPMLRFSGQQQWRSLSRIIEDTSAGRLDVACALQDSGERRRKLHVIDIPIWTVSYHLLMRATDNATPQSWDEVKALAPDNRVLVNAGSSVIRKLKLDGINLDSGAQSVRQNIDKLLRGRGRFYYVRVAGLKEELGGNEAHVKILPTEMGTETFYVMTSPLLAESVRVQLRAAITYLNESGQLQLLRQRWLN